MQIGEVEVELPPGTDLVKMAAAKLQARLKEIRAEAYQEEKAVQQRLDKLLALPAPGMQEF